MRKKIHCAYPSTNLSTHVRRYIKTSNDPYEHSKYVTQVSFDFGHNGDYDEKFIETGIKKLLSADPKLEFTGYVDFRGLD